MAEIIDLGKAKAFERPHVVLNASQTKLHKELTAGDGRTMPSKAVRAQLICVLKSDPANAGSDLLSSAVRHLSADNAAALIREVKDALGAAGMKKLSPQVLATMSGKLFAATFTYLSPAQAKAFAEGLFDNKTVGLCVELARLSQQARKNPVLNKDKQKLANKVAARAAATAFKHWKADGVDAADTVKSIIESLEEVDTVKRNLDWMDRKKRNLNNIGDERKKQTAPGQGIRPQ